MPQKDDFGRVLEFIGALSTLVGTAVLFFQEKYVAGSLVAIIFVALLSIIVLRIFRAPLSVQSVKYDVRIEDAAGHKTLVKKTRRIKVVERNVTCLIDRNLSSAGKIELISSNLGDESRMVDEGGTKSIYTTFKAPLPVGKVVEHVLDMIYWDTFPENTETCSYLVSDRHQEFGYVVEFPTGRPPRAPRAYRVYRQTLTELDSLSIVKGGTLLRLTQAHPKLGARYFIEWKW